MLWPMRDVSTIQGRNGLAMFDAFHPADEPAGTVLKAVLGPTNTGKTHFAVERMLAHSSGMMGFPLRLLAREIYDRVVAIKGESRVALITGEEKLGRTDAPYVIATVEAMPVHRKMAFIAIDEIQLCADFDRGHIFTERLLNARGYAETIFLGSDTIRPLIRRLVPQAEIITRPRFSTLSYDGQVKLHRLPRRSAIVAFTASEVYALAEMIRRRRGGAAVVMGSLSPRTRNAQVELYQSGEVDHLVATDAIGMGLNMDLAHVTFADWHKFDGRETRRLTPSEIGQIAGRAGRHMRDGTFGTTTRAEPFDTKTIEAVEQHHFLPVKALRWRNDDLDFRSIARLKDSLDAPPPSPVLLKVRDALDDRCLALLARHEEVCRRATNRDSVMLLWQVCQIPDFRKTITDAHLHLLSSIFNFLTSGARKLPNDWVASMISRLEHADGDIDALTNRIAHIRTWTYLSHREEWLHDPLHWQARAREVEDKLSDALHARLTQKFVDRRTAALMRTLQGNGDFAAIVEEDGEIAIDGHVVGKINGFVFTPAPADADMERKVLIQAAKRTVAMEVKKLAHELAAARDQEFRLCGKVIYWREWRVARLARGQKPLEIRIEPLTGESLLPNDRLAVTARVQQWLDDWLDRAIGCLRRLRQAADDKSLSAAARGLLFRMTENQGLLITGQQQDLTSALTAKDRKQLARLGVRLGVLAIYMPDLLKPLAGRALGLIKQIETKRAIELPPPGRVSLRGPEHSKDSTLFGYVPMGKIAMRADIAERVGMELRRHARGQANFDVPLDLLALSGLSKEEFASAMPIFGFRTRQSDAGITQIRRAGRPKPRRPRERETRKDEARRGPVHSPFGVLAQLALKAGS